MPLACQVAVLRLRAMLLTKRQPEVKARTLRLIQRHQSPRMRRTDQVVESMTARAGSRVIPARDPDAAPGNENADGDPESGPDADTPVEDGGNDEPGVAPAPGGEAPADGDEQEAAPDNPDGAVVSPGQGEASEGAGGSGPDAGSGITGTDAGPGDSPGTSEGTSPSAGDSTGSDQAEPEPDAELEQDIAEPEISTPVPGQEDTGSNDDEVVTGDQESDDDKADADPADVPGTDATGPATTGDEEAPDQDGPGATAGEGDATEPDDLADDVVAEPGASSSQAGEVAGESPDQTLDDPGVEGTPDPSSVPDSRTGQDAEAPDQEAIGDAKTNVEDTDDDGAPVTTSADPADGDVSANAGGQAKDQVKDMPRTGAGSDADGTSRQFAALIFALGGAMLAVAAGWSRRRRVNSA